MDKEHFLMKFFIELNELMGLMSTNFYFKIFINIFILINFSYSSFVLKNNN